MATGQSRISPFQLAQFLAPQQQVPLSVPGSGIVNASNSLLRAAMLNRLMRRETEQQQQTAATRQADIARVLAAGGGQPAETVPGGRLGATFGGGFAPTEPGPSIPPGVTPTMPPSEVGPITFNERPFDRRAMAQALAGSQTPAFQEAGVNMLLQDPKTTDPETFSQPFAATDAEGNPVLVQSGNRGSIRQVEGFAPEAAKSGKFRTFTNPTTNEQRAAREGSQEAAELVAAGFTPGRPQRPLVEISGGEEQSAFDKEFGKRQAASMSEQITNIETAGEAARRSNARLNDLDRLLDEVNVGPGARTRQGLARVVTALGFETDIAGDLGAAEAAEALANEMALEFRNPAGGAGMPGAMSDKDREFLVSITPNMSQTHEGRKLIVAARRKLNQRNIEVRQFAREWRRNNDGRLGLDFEIALEERFGSNPEADLFSGEEFNQASSGAPPAGSEFNVKMNPDGTFNLDPVGP